MQLERHPDSLELSNSDINDTILTRRLGTAAPCRVLIVDDDDLVRARLAALLRVSGFEVEIAASGEEALSIMNKRHCQVLLTDWQMPHMDGLDLCRIARINQKESYVYILMLTVRDSQEDLLAGLAAGADDYVVKGAPHRGDSRAPGGRTAHHPCGAVTAREQPGELGACRSPIR